MSEITNLEKITNTELQNKLTWTEKFRENLVLQVLNLKSEPDFLKQVLEYNFFTKFDDINIRIYTEFLLMNIQNYNIVKLADIMAYIACVKNEKQKNLGMLE